MDTAVAAAFDFELVSPEARLIAGPAWQVTLPGEAGEFGVRAGHEPLMASLKPGILLVQDQAGGEARALFISGGFADVTPSHCTVLADEAIALTDIDAAALKKELADLTEDLSIANEHHTQDHLRERIALIEAKLAAVSA